MNLASWVILAVVFAIVVLAIRATFFKKARKGGCCDAGDKPADSLTGCSPSHCASCSMCHECKH